MTRLIALLALSFAMLLVATTADAATVYTARFGTNSANGAATITGTKLYLNAKALSAGTWAETLWRGTCAKRGTKLLELPKLTVSTAGKVARTNTLTTSVANAAHTGVLRLTRGTRTVCGAFAGPPAASSIPGGLVLLKVHGSGDAIENATVVFNAPANWHIDFSFDCSKWSAAAPFTVSVLSDQQRVAEPVDTSGLTGSGTANLRGMAGPFSLDIVTNCAWSVEAVTDPSPRPAATPPPVSTVPPTPTPPDTGCAGGCLFAMTGQGDSTTSSFAIPNSWILRWSYDCTTTGAAAGLDIALYINDQAMPEGVNDAASSGSGTLAIDEPDGQAYLTIDSDCQWSVSAVSA